MIKNFVISKKKNPGSVESQVFNFTNKIRRLTSHFKLHPKDYYLK